MRSTSGRLIRRAYLPSKLCQGRATATSTNFHLRSTRKFATSLDAKSTVNDYWRKRLSALLKGSDAPPKNLIPGLDKLEQMMNIKRVSVTDFSSQN